jgi:hypothetical protein
MKRIADWFILTIVMCLMICGYLFYSFIFPIFRPRTFIKLFAIVSFTVLLGGTILWIVLLKPAYEPRQGPLV